MAGALHFGREYRACVHSLDAAPFVAEVEDLRILARQRSRIMHARHYLDRDAARVNRSGDPAHGS